MRLVLAPVKTITHQRRRQGLGKNPQVCQALRALDRDIGTLLMTFYPTLFQQMLATSAGGSASGALRAAHATVVLAKASIAALTSGAATRNKRLPRLASTRNTPLAVSRARCALADVGDNPASVANSTGDLAEPSIKAHNMAVRLGSASKLAI
ncbi:hypothetical protein AO284_12680 [Pseudomonas sp. NZIPFR-PS2]|nr:hypothetical protein AO284_12680 [Pseudomonas sp. NZIPFR-PS2]